MRESFGLNIFTLVSGMSTHYRVDDGLLRLRIPFPSNSPPLHTLVVIISVHVGEIGQIPLFYAPSSFTDIYHHLVLSQSPSWLARPYGNFKLRPSVQGILPRKYYSSGSVWPSPIYFNLNLTDIFACFEFL